MLSQYKRFIYTITLGLLGVSCNHLSHQQMNGANAHAKGENTENNRSNTTEECSICLDPINTTENKDKREKRLFLQKCNHAFHLGCILSTMTSQYDLHKQAYISGTPDCFDIWHIIKEKLSCPLCRTPIDDPVLLDITMLQKMQENEQQKTDVLLGINEWDNTNLLAKILRQLKDRLSTYNNTLLHLANSVQVATLLIEQGADVNARNSHQDTPLHLANSVQVATLLIEQGADVNAQNAQLWTPLHVAADNNNTEMIQFLIDNKADINKPNDWNWRPLTLAVQSSHRAAIELLIQHGADINAKSNYGFKMQDGNLTPLHIAILLGRQEAVRLLVEQKADLNAQSIYGFTPLHLAALCKNVSFKQLTHDTLDPSEKKTYAAIIAMLEQHPKTDLTIKNRLNLSHQELENIDFCKDTNTDLAAFKHDCKKWFINPMERET